MSGICHSVDEEDYPSKSMDAAYRVSSSEKSHSIVYARQIGINSEALRGVAAAYAVAQRHHS